MTGTTLAYQVSGWLVGAIAAAISCRWLHRRREANVLTARDLDAWGYL